MTHEHILNLDPVIHTPVRLAVVSILAAVEEADFRFLRESTETTDGNLSTHLAKLEQAGYIKTRKLFKDKKPKTVCSLTRKGRNAFTEYLDRLETIVSRQKRIEEE
jgi:DNA-binding MarR family transcriptional regulator